MGPISPPKIHQPKSSVCCPQENWNKSYDQELLDKVHEVLEVSDVRIIQWVLWILKIKEIVQVVSFDELLPIDGINRTWNRNIGKRL